MAKTLSATLLACVIAFWLFADQLPIAPGTLGSIPLYPLNPGDFWVYEVTTTGSSAQILPWTMKVLEQTPESFFQAVLVTGFPLDAALHKRIDASSRAILIFSRANEWFVIDRDVDRRWRELNGKTWAEQPFKEQLFLHFPLSLKAQFGCDGGPCWRVTAVTKAVLEPTTSQPLLPSNDQYEIQGRMAGSAVDFTFLPGVGITKVVCPQSAGGSIIRLDLLEAHTGSYTRRLAH